MTEDAFDGTKAGAIATALVTLLAVSGCAALIYQVVWFQLLGLVLGASTISIGVLLATFMGGMSLGSAFFARFVSPRHHPIRVLAWVELGIAGFGLGIFYGLPEIGGLYTAWAGSGTPGLLLRALVAVTCLLPPTILMGATLPAVARWTATTPRGVEWIGFLYSSNIAGAVVGAVLAGFYLLRIYDVALATFVAVALNGAVACGALVLAAAARRGASDAGRGKAAGPAEGWPIYAAIALSGATALAAEVIWTRALSLLLGATVYAFALIVAVFLLGLGIGSGVGARLARHVDTRTTLGYCQLLLCLAIAWGAYVLAESLPYWPLDVTLPTADAVTLQVDLLRTAYAVLPGALLWGASFPLALAAVAANAVDPGKLVGRVYAANTIGAICGALAASFAFVPWLGSRGAQQVLIVLAAGSALLVLVRRRAHRLPWVARAGTVTAASVLLVALAYSVPELPRELVAYGRFQPTRGVGANVIYAGEGRSASIAVSEEENGARTFHSAGKAQASTYPQDMRLQRMLGHLTTLISETGQTFLVIGLGAGITAGAVGVDPRAERVVVAEIEPLVRHAAAQYFREQNFGVVDNPIVEVQIDDGRHYLATTDETFDGITSDPLDPWVKGAAALYTREFWQLVRSRLSPGGVVTVFVQLYETTEDAVKSEVATFFDVFPNGAVFANTVQGMGYDVVLLGRVGDAPIDLGQIERRLESVEYERVRRSLGAVGFRSAVDLLGTYAGQSVDLAAWLEDAEINTDRNFRLQYLAGQGLNIYAADEIFGSMTERGGRFPEGLFSGPPSLLEDLRHRIEAGQIRF